MVLIASFILLQLTMYLGIFSIENYFYINLTHSQPIGIYRVIEAKPQTIAYGDLVVIPIPEKAKELAVQRGWALQETTLLKNVTALPGDSFEITDDYISVNGETIGPILNQDSAGRSMPLMKGTFGVKTGYFLPIATHVPNSYDGRYFGTVEQSSIIAKVKPFILFPEGL